MDLKVAILKQALRLDKLGGGRKQTPDVFSVSEVGRCRKETYLKKMGYKNEIRADTPEDKARVIMLLNDGRFHQRTVTEYLWQAPGYHITNIEEDRYIFRTLENGRSYAIIGHPDGIVYGVEEKKRAVLEIKGLSRFLCRDFKGNPRLVDEDIETLQKVYPSAIPQTLLYIEMFETEEGVVIVKNKDTSELFQFTIKRNKDRTDKIIERLDVLYMACATSTPPVCDFIKSSKECKYCPFPEHCGE